MIRRCPCDYAGRWYIGPGGSEIYLSEPQNTPDDAYFAVTRIDPDTGDPSFGWVPYEEDDDAAGV